MLIMVHCFFFVGSVGNAEPKYSGLMHCWWRSQILVERKVMFLPCIWESKDVFQRSISI